MTDITTRLDAIEAFLDGRTIGCEGGTLHWRGPGYDDGWADLTDGEVAGFADACGLPAVVAALRDALAERDAVAAENARLVREAAEVTE